jgi:excisionase family DNA binding protein
MSPDLRECTMRAGHAARRLGVDASTVWHWGNRGILPFAKTVGGHRRYRPSDVEELARRLEAGEDVEPPAAGADTPPRDADT